MISVEAYIKSLIKITTIRGKTKKVKSFFCVIGGLEIIALKIDDLFLFLVYVVCVCVFFLSLIHNISI